MQSIRSLSTQRLTIGYAYRLASGRLHPLVLRALRNKRIEQIAATDRHQLHKLEPTTGPAAPAVGLGVRQTIEEVDMTLSEAKKLSHLLARIGAHLDQSAEFVRDHDTEKNFA